MEIDLPSQEDNNKLKYSLITTSSDGKKIIYLKKKDNSKETSTDPDDVISKFVEDGEISKKPKNVKRKQIKNAKAFLTSSFPKEPKCESQKVNKIDNSSLGGLQRFSSATSKAKENILEIETLKSTSKDSRTKKTSQKKK